MTQAELRMLKRQQRKAISAVTKAQYSQQIAKTFLHSQAYQNAKHLAVYLALPEEVCTNAIIEAAWADSKQVYLPVVTAKGQAMQFAPYFSDSTLTKDTMKMFIPSCNTSHYIRANQLDSVITPLVAFDRHTNRIGMGGGFYDRTFAFKRNSTQNAPQLIGIAFESQRTDTTITAADWDIALDQIITEKAVYSA